ncbi:hypothetical protein EDB86DRAFT_3170569 [Lactarius hatsudake]|nr:hypothetical protein EDB86DRAFT_3170569 [Lactarius hatsudake]
MALRAVELGRCFNASSDLHGAECLTLLDFMRSQLPTTEPAFLSACHTARMKDTSIADNLEVLRCVIETVQEFADIDSWDLTEHFYTRAETLNKIAGLGTHECSLPVCPHQVHLDTPNGQNWGCKAAQGVVQPAVHASAGREMSAKVARECGEVGRGYTEPESRVVASDWKWSRKLLRGVKLCRGGRRSRERVRFESLRLRISAARWRTQGMGLTGPQSPKSRKGKSILFSEAKRTQSAGKRESAGKQGLESVQNTAKSGQAWCQREQDCRGEQRLNDTNIWVSPTALGGATPMDSATADAPVEAQIGTIEDGGQLLQAQVSSFRQKQKIRKMAEISTTGSAEGRRGWMPEVLDTNDHDDVLYFHI